MFKLVDKSNDCEKFSSCHTVSLLVLVKFFRRIGYHAFHAVFYLALICNRYLYVTSQCRAEIVNPVLDIPILVIHIKRPVNIRTVCDTLLTKQNSLLSK